MLRHERTVHALEKSRSCGTCNTTFPDQDALNAHCAAEQHALPVNTTHVRKKTSKKTIKPRTEQASPSESLQNPVKTISSHFISLVGLKQEVNITAPIPEDSHQSSWNAVDQTSQAHESEESLESNEPLPESFHSFPTTHPSFTIPIPDPAYSQFTTQLMNNLEPVFVPDMNQVGYQMNLPVKMFEPKCS